MSQVNFKNTNLFLIGMMGSWKSTVGRKLAEILNLEFVDTDDEIEKITNMKITDIFNEFSEQRFREMESAFFIEKTKSKKQLFSTGGGIILDKRNRRVLNNNGICILLEASSSTLAKRIYNTTKRPLLDQSDDLHKSLYEIWENRKSYYKECAKYTINTDPLNPNEVINKILLIFGYSN